MTERDEMVRNFIDARGRGDEAALARLLEEVPTDELGEFMEAVEAQVPPGEHSLDIELLHSALRRAGFDAEDTLRMSALGAAELGGYLATTLRAPERLDAVASELIGQVDGLAEHDLPAVTRYLRRVRDGRHDVRRLSDKALSALATSAQLPLAVLQALRDTADARPGWSAGRTIAAARGGDGSEPSLLDDVARFDDAVDRLFNGRVPPTT